MTRGATSSFDTPARQGIGLGGLIWAVLIVVAITAVLSKPFVSSELTKDSSLRWLILGLVASTCVTGIASIRRGGLRSPVTLSMAILTTMLGAGSLYRTAILNEDISFRAHFVASLGFWAVLALTYSGRLLFCQRFLTRCLSVSSVLLLPAILWFFIEGVERIHEMVYLFVPIGVILAFRGGLVPTLAGAGYLLVWIVFGMKNTTVIIGGFCMLVLAYGQWLRLRTHASSTTSALALIIGSVAMAGAAGVYALIRSELPVSSGNADFRMHLYEKVFNLFLDSPLWGTCFSSSPVWEFTLFDMGNAGGGAGSQVLPSHSDILDMLGHGGLVAFIPVLVIFLALLGWLFRHLRSVAMGLQQPGILLFPLIAVSGMIQMSFNPVLLELPNGILLCTAIGLSYATRPDKAVIDAEPDPYQFSRQRPRPLPSARHGRTFHDYPTRDTRLRLVAAAFDQDTPLTLDRFHKLMDDIAAHPQQQG